MRTLYVPDAVAVVLPAIEERVQTADLMRTEKETRLRCWYGELHNNGREHLVQWRAGAMSELR